MIEEIKARHSFAEINLGRISKEQIHADRAYLLEHNKALVEALELAKNLFYVITCSNEVDWMKSRAEEGFEEIQQALTTYKGEIEK
jgi:hypothetical protein